MAEEDSEELASPRLTQSEPADVNASAPETAEGQEHAHERSTPFSSRSASPEPINTPSLSGLKKSLSVKNLQSLELSRVRSGVWRKPGERRKHPKDLEQLVYHVLSGSIRAFTTAYGLRAFFNLILVLFRLLRTSRVKSTLLVNALAGVDNWRFASMMGSFVFLFKWVHHGLRIYNPGPRGKGKQEHWHAATAGAFSALAILCEKPSRRITYAQQLFVRGLQGSYNMLHARNLIHIPQGDVLLFGAACGQIMYAWLMAPESLPPGYLRWVTNAARVPPPVMPLNLARQRYGQPFDVADLQKLLARKDVTSSNRFALERYLQDAKNDILGPPFAICAAVHPHVDDCKVVPFERFQAVFRWIFPVYAGLHTAPPILLRSKRFFKDPLSMLTKSAVGTIRSASFLSTFVVLFQTLVCVQRNTYIKFGHVMPDWFNRFILSRYYYWFIGFLTCLPLYIEEKKRRGELAMYVLPKALESVWSIARRRHYVPFVPGGEVLLTAAGLAQVMSAYVHDPMRLSGLVRTLIYQFVGTE